MDCVEELIKERERIYKKYNKGGNCMKERFKSPVFWCQLLLLIAEVVKLCGGYEISNDILNSAQDLITLGFQVFSGLNNPTSRKNF